ncbi:GGDEF domain-containing protein [Streptomyces sp. AJ-1]|uniref:GGDEF domain-containing protein n=1 Tax=Streptomyces sp. AJ-1 TaxID=3044384 RepID=UPI00249C149E|nr:GGDEF domain-containing protein [Streptomyces sp. AJ-1]MDI3344359.1 GGDEF domain-containing protein [Streptomyces sp. AJ-1]
MSQALTMLAAAAPLAAGWSLHGLWMRRRIEAARHDPLTGLATRELFEICAPKLLKPGAAVMVIDLDGFKALNDRHGHAAGDAALIESAHTLASRIAVLDGCVARLGGDEFALLAPLPRPGDLPYELTALHEALCEPFRFEDQEVTVGASLGAVLIGDGPVPPLEQLLRRADEAMYAAKAVGGGWFIAPDATPALPSINGRRAGRPGTGLEGGTL